MCSFGNGISGSVSSGLQGNPLIVPGIGDGLNLLLEGTVNCVTTEAWLSAKLFIGNHTEVARQAASIQPFDSNGFTDFGLVIGHEISSGNNISCTLVSTNKWKLSW